MNLDGDIKLDHYINTTIGIRFSSYLHVTFDNLKICYNMENVIKKLNIPQKCSEKNKITTFLEKKYTS